MCSVSPERMWFASRAWAEGGDFKVAAHVWAPLTIRGQVSGGAIGGASFSEPNLTPVTVHRWTSAWSRDRIVTYIPVVARASDVGSSEPPLGSSVTAIAATSSRLACIIVMTSPSESGMNVGPGIVVPSSIISHI